MPESLGHSTAWRMPITGPQEIMAGNSTGDRTEGLESGLSWRLPRPAGSALSVSAGLSDPMQSEEQLESML